MPIIASWEEYRPVMLPSVVEAQFAISVCPRHLVHLRFAHIPTMRSFEEVNFPVNANYFPAPIFREFATKALNSND